MKSRPAGPLRRDTVRNGSVVGQDDDHRAIAADVSVAWDAQNACVVIEIEGEEFPIYCPSESRDDVISLAEALAALLSDLRRAHATANVTTLALMAGVLALGQLEEYRQRLSELDVEAAETASGDGNLPSRPSRPSKETQAMQADIAGAIARIAAVTDRVDRERRF